MVAAFVAAGPPGTTYARGMKTLTHVIAGEAYAGSGDRFGEVFDPATGEVTARVPFANQRDVDAAVAAAKAAFPAWAAIPPLKRARVLFKFKQLLEEHAAELAAIVTSEHGKVLSDARGSVARGIEVVEFACGI